MATFWDRKEDRKERKPGRLPLILLCTFAIACLVALLFVGDLARYQEAAMVDESKAALREVGDPQQLDQALKQFPANRILRLVALAGKDAGETDAALQKLLNEIEPAGLANPVDLTTASRATLEALRRDLKTAEGNSASFKARYAELIKARRTDAENAARALGVESTTLTRFMAALDEQHSEMTALAAKVLAARAEYYSAYEKCAALLVKEFGSYKVTNGQFIFRLQPAVDSYNAASSAMATAMKRIVDLENEKSALKQSHVNRWKNFVGA